MLFLVFFSADFASGFTLQFGKLIVLSVFTSGLVSELELFCSDVFDALESELVGVFGSRGFWSDFLDSTLGVFAASCRT